MKIATTNTVIKNPARAKYQNFITFFFLAIRRDPFLEGFNLIFFNLDDFLRNKQGYNNNQVV